MEVELIASSVIPLLVALLNLLVAGYVLTLAAKDRGQILFALGPTGVGIWALAWFISVFDTSSLPDMRRLAALGGALAISGFAADALREVEAARARLIAVLVLVFLFVGVGIAHFSAGPQFGVVLAAYFVDFAAVTVVLAVRLPQRRSPDLEVRQFSRWVLWSTGIIGVTALLFTTFCIVVGRRIDPLRFVILLSEVYLLFYILQRRVEVHVLVSRAVTYSMLSVFVAGLAVLVFAQLGYAFDVVVITVTVVIALAASALFMGLGDRLSGGVERILFPDHARIERALVASRGELEALQRRLERAEKLAITGELAASVAHEIKNPLAPIRGYAQLLDGKLKSVSDQERAIFAKGLKIIREETDRIDHRVADLLEAARAGRETASFDERFEVNRVVIEAAAVAEGEPGVSRILRHLDPQIDHAVGNEDEIRGALLNLMKNAAEAMIDEAGSTIEVVTKKEGNLAVIEVLDEGPGIGPLEAERVFQAFHTTKKGGTGLGLAIARSAVDAAGGRITIGSRPDKSGALVRIELDLDLQEQEASEPSAAPQVVGGP